MCNDCMYTNTRADEKPCNNCMDFVDGILTAVNYERGLVEENKDNKIAMSGKVIKSICKNMDDDVVIILTEGVLIISHDIYERPHVRFEAKYSGNCIGGLGLVDITIESK